MEINYEEQAKQLIQEIYPYVCDCNDPEDYQEAIGYFNLQNHTHICFKYGSTRVVFITNNYVIKIDCGRPHDLRDFGTCAKEVAMYARARKDGFDYLFAKITRYFYKHMNFYIMPLINDVGTAEENADYYMDDIEYTWIMEQHLFDLHSMNFGWKNGHVCLIDYAAYDDDDEEE